MPQPNNGYQYWNTSSQATNWATTQHPPPSSPSPLAPSSPYPPFPSVPPPPDPATSRQAALRTPSPHHSS